MRNYTTKAPTCATTPDIPRLLCENYDLFLSLDCEYTATPDIAMPKYGLSFDRPMTPPRNAQTNMLLSFQGMAVCLRSGQEYKALWDYRSLPCPTLGDLIRRAMAGLGVAESILRARDSKDLLRIMVAWHWGSAEMGMLADALGVNGIMAHQKEIPDMSGPVLTLKPVEYHFNLRDGHDNQGRVMLTLRDTRCLIGFAIVIAQKWSLSNLRDAGWMPCPV